MNGKFKHFLAEMFFYADRIMSALNFVTTIAKSLYLADINMGMNKLLSILLLLLCTHHVYSQTKRSLIVAIGKYAPLEGKGWRQISSDNDTTLILPALKKQGFKKENTTLIINEQGTIENIRASLKKLALETKPNDIVFIHISAHGCQVDDDNGDEIDGLDESIVTYNAIQPTKSTDFKKDAMQYLRDDELGEMIDEIRQGAGKNGEVLVIMDNCHSGSGTRAVDAIYRGGEPAFRSKDPVKPYQKENSVSGDNFSLSDNLAPYVVISGSRADERNAEIRIGKTGYGSLSYAVSEALNDLLPESTYQGFYSKVLSTMNELVPAQHPVIEGNALNKIFWKGDFKTKPLFYNVIKIKEEQVIDIDGGIISGISKGSVIHLYPIDTYDTTKSKAIAIGTVILSENFKATVELDRPIPLNSTAYWAFVKKVYYPVSLVGISFETTGENGEAPLSAERKKQYTDILSGLEQVDLNAVPSLRIVRKNNLEVLTDIKSNYIFENLGNGSVDAARLKLAVERYVQYQFLKSYTITDQDYKISVRFLPYRCDETDGKTCKKGELDTTLLKSKLINGVYTFNVGDYFLIEVNNESQKQVYFNVIDLEPGGCINVILPSNPPAPMEPITSEDLVLKPGEKRIFDYRIKLNPPVGDEVFKFFVSNKPLNLQNIIQTRGESTRSFTSDMEQVFKNSYRSNSRGNLGTQDGSVINVPFIIAPLKN
jgi:hypothetical protein